MQPGKVQNISEVRGHTDSVIAYLEGNHEAALDSFTSYTFLERLDSVRLAIDSFNLRTSDVMHFYSTLIFRLNTLNTVSHGSEVYLRPIYPDMVSQKLLSEMITNLGIIRSNIYNVLYTRQYMVETLLGMAGLNDINQSYEKEFYIKASDSAKHRYTKLKIENAELRQTLEYIDLRFKTYSFDSTFDAETWWEISDKGIDQLVLLQQQTWNSVREKTAEFLKRETMIRDRTMIFLISSLIFVILIIAYAVRVITRMLNELKLAAQEISRGETPDNLLEKDTDDVVGSLAQCISKIDENNRKLAQAANAIGKGNFDVAIEARSNQDVLGNAIIQMKNNLQQLNAELKQKVIESGQANEQLRDLSAHLQNIREEERIHIAREMHDELGQLLTGFKMDTNWLNKRVSAIDDPMMKEKLTSMSTLIDESVKFVRELAAELRPSILDDLGLIAALEWHSEEFRKRYNIEVEFLSQVEELNTPPLIATGLFRIYQESLTNVARHSEATKVNSSFEVSNDKICLTITDNGKGFDTTSRKRTLGLLGMRERAAMIGGELKIHSVPGEGTTISIIVNHSF
jgi:signal transduction histidine kinase